MISRVRALWRRARALPLLRGILRAGDRLWWARIVRRADIVDMPLVRAQGHRGSERAAVRRYVRGGFQTGFSLNPLFMERLVASQLSDVGRVPALYAYLVNDQHRIEMSVNWDARTYGSIPGVLDDPAGPLGRAWRDAKRDGVFALKGRSVAWTDVERAAISAAAWARAVPVPALTPLDAEVVLLCRIGGYEDATASLRLAGEFASTGVAVVIGLAPGNADQWISAAQFQLRFPCVQLAHDDDDLLARVRSAAPDATMLVRGPSAEISATELRALAAVASEGRAAAPVWVDALDGTVVSAGVGFHDGIAFDLLAGFPIEDTRELGDRIDVPSIRGRTFAEPAVRTADPVVVTSAVVRAPAEPIEDADAAQPDTALDAILAPTGFMVGGWGRSGPQLKRERTEVTLASGERVPRLRWAIKIAAPPGPRGEWWGDTHFARGIAAALTRLGQEVVIDAYAARDRVTAELDDVMLALRGPEAVHARAGTRSLLWIISHPDEITPADLDGYDTVFAASSTWAESASRTFGRPILPLMQCTDPNRFQPRGLARSGGLVFVGTARGIPRPSIIEPLRAGVSVSVYGPDWSGWIPGAAIKGTGVPNSELPAIYERAGAVLNDHWPAMHRHGFISNRLFDVVAAGGRVISDDVPGIRDVFDGAVWTYATTPELVDAVRGDLDELFPNQQALAAVSARIRADHSFDARARELLSAVRWR